MAYSSKTDAVAKLIDSKTDHNGLMLYSNNVLFDSTTIFYSDSAKTTLATAGNYVFPTNYNSIYVTIGSDGKIVGSASHTNATNSDTTWIDDRVYDGSGILISNQGTIGGTNLTIVNNVVTDNAWTSRPYINPKAFQINNAPLNQTNSLANIDVSEMKGYDLMIYTGEFYDYHWGQFNWVQAFCHIKADPNRQSVFTNKIYYFKPDYWIPNSGFTGGVTYFRRMPNITTINDQWGNKKMWIDMANPAHDIAENTGVPRTSTRMAKGLTHAENFSAYGYSFSNPKASKFTFFGDIWIIYTICWLEYGDTTEAHVNYLMSIWFNNDYYQNWAVALVESVTVSDSVWATGYATVGGMKYTDANPYHWKLAYNSGTNYDNKLHSNLTTYFYASNELNGDQIQFDSEYYYKYSFSKLFGESWKALIENVAYRMLITEGQQALGAVQPNFSGYHGNLYEVGNQWESEFNSATVTSNINYLDYHNYMNDLMPKENIFALNKFYLGCYDSYSMSSITNYQISPFWQHAIYGLVHNYDISKKVFAEIFTTYNHKMRCLPYTWNRQDIVGDAGNKDIRLAIPYRLSRPDQSPSLNQSLAVWGMAYADGFFAWNDGTLFDEFNTTAESQTLGRASWDWAYVGYWQVYQNKDIVEASTSWLVPDLEKSAGVWTTTTENYPITLFAYKRPICRYKLSSDGTKAMVICTNGFNNGYTKATFKFRLPAKSNFEFTIDTWGTYTTVVRLINL